MFVEYHLSSTLFTRCCSRFCQFDQISETMWWMERLLTFRTPKGICSSHRKSFLSWKNSRFTWKYSRWLRYADWRGIIDESLLEWGHRQAFDCCFVELSRAEFSVVKNQFWHSRRPLNSNVFLYEGQREQWLFCLWRHLSVPRQLLTEQRVQKPLS